MVFQPPPSVPIAARAVELLTADPATASLEAGRKAFLETGCAQCHRVGEEGGSVGDLTTLIIGNPELAPGSSYVLFLNDEDLPGGKALTVRSLIQGAFDVKIGRDGLRAVSQANAHPLLPDAFGSFEAAGGAEGYPLNSMMQSIRDMAARDGARREVK